jgi:hypothetical protein
MAGACCRDDCARLVGRNGVACSQHWPLVPDFLASAWFRNRRHDDFTARWLAEQVAHAVRGEPFTA